MLKNKNKTFFLKEDLNFESLSLFCNEIDLIKKLRVEYFNAFWKKEVTNLPKVRSTINEVPQGIWLRTCQSGGPA